MNDKIEIDKKFLETLLKQIPKERRNKKRPNGMGTVAFLGSNRYKPYAARILIGKDINGLPIY